jgi:hypothetical protein
LVSDVEHDDDRERRTYDPRDRDRHRRSNRIGMRFTQVAVPHGATVTNAYVQFKADENSSEATSLTINGIAQDNANAFPTAVFSLSRAARTSAAVGWNPVAWVERASISGRRTSRRSCSRSSTGRGGHRGTRLRW